MNRALVRRTWRPAAAWEHGRTILDRTRRDDLSGLAAELAFRLLLALFPFLIVVGSLAAYVASWIGVSDPSGELVDAVASTLPDDSRAVFEREVRSVLETTRPELLSLGLVAGLWAASRVVAALAKAMNRVYEVEEARPFLQRQLLAVGVTLSGLLQQFTAGDLAADQHRESNHEEQPGAVAFIYRFVPNTALPWRRIWIGAAGAVLAWVAATFLFGIYLANFGSYEATYGALGGAVILLVWLYVSAFVVLAGALLNRWWDDRRTPRPRAAS